MKTKPDKGENIKLKIFYEKGKQLTKFTEWEEIFANHTSDKEVVQNKGAQMSK